MRAGAPKRSQIWHRFVSLVVVVPVGVELRHGTLPRGGRPALLAPEHDPRDGIERRRALETERFHLLEQERGDALHRVVKFPPTPGLEPDGRLLRRLGLGAPKRRGARFGYGGGPRRGRARFGTLGTLGTPVVVVVVVSDAQIVVHSQRHPERVSDLE